MAFKGIKKDLLEKVKGWRLHESIRQGLVNGIAHLSQMCPSKLPADDAGMFFTVDVDDESAGCGGHIFQLRIARNDEEFWVKDIYCFEVNSKNEIIWTSTGFMP